jgi:predicted permease
MTAATLASSGFYLHRRQMITSDGKKAMARFSQQLALPALYFTKIVACSAASSPKQQQTLSSSQEEEICPNMVLDNLNEVWILVVWPLYVVGWGLLLGELANYLCDTPAWYRKSALAACAIGNSSSLPLALLAAIYSPSSTTASPQGGEGRIDPTVLLSIYFLLYPLLQWAMGSWLLSPDKHPTTKEAVEEEDTPHHTLPGFSDEGEEDPSNRSGLEGELTPSSVGATLPIQLHQRKTTLGVGGGVGDTLRDDANRHGGTATGPGERKATTTTTPGLLQMLQQVGMELVQPPAVGSLLGFLVSSMRPLRGLFVNLHRGGGDPLLSWLFRGLVVVRKISEAWEGPLNEVVPV